MARLADAFLASFGLIVATHAFTLPHGHELDDVVDKGFKMIDTNHDGTLQFSELERVYLDEDINGDGNLTLAEYEASIPYATDLADKLFMYYDSNSDGVLPIRFAKTVYSWMDTNHNSEVSEHEYVHYMHHLLTLLFDHSQGHHDQHQPHPAPHHPHP